eukprot:TRINITY_DN4601_c0_g1_i1.p1 TRINITY_DN4601_c0_g1~~TRINITY_DN4601_c0_g1_i1.p1  ORF type:complete len:542 (+),score=103.70 TRINITY_DN4601_c0_g1_i1:60-1685(+)
MTIAALSPLVAVQRTFTPTQLCFRALCGRPIDLSLHSDIVGRRLFSTHDKDNRDQTLIRNTLSRQFISEYWRSLRDSIMSDSQLYTPIEDGKDGNSEMKSALQGTLRSLQGRASVVVPAIMTRRLCTIYGSSDQNRKLSFLTMMANELGINHEVASKAAEGFMKAQKESPNHILVAENNLRKALTPIYEKVFLQVSAQPEGTKFLVDLRADMLSAIDADPSNINLRSMEECLKRMLSMWFTVGLLQHRRITWMTATDTLEKIKNYEAVHPIPNWEYLKSRVDHPRRRCYAFFHPTMPREPLVFVHVALLDHMADNIQKILEGAMQPTDKTPPITHAIFYSISATQKGLRNIDLGNFLIKRVVMTLKEEFPDLQNFATLSPIPGFRSWLDRQFKSVEQSKVLVGQIFAPQEQAIIQKLSQSEDVCKGFTAIMNSLPSGSNDEIRTIVTRLCARYLYSEKKGKHAADPVANFHLQNGARMGRLNYAANTAAAGVKQSATMMINYEYILSDIEQNYRTYWEDGVIQASPEIVTLALQGKSQSRL